MTTYLLRPSRPTDWPAVRNLARRVYREFRIIEQPDDAPPRLGLDELAWVVETGRGEIVGGCVVCERGGGEWWIESLFVAQGWRGFGIGRALVEQALGAVQERGALRLVCDLPADVVEAASLLERLGFRAEPTSNDRANRRISRTLTAAS